jgi:dihydroorotate dehydrogenase
LKINISGMEFQNPIGLAAGFDKRGELLDRISCLGFGFTEIGTITPYAQEGNPKPRLFRLKGERALLNRLGFNNGGVVEVKEYFKQLNRKRIPIGINIGKNRNTILKDAGRDYLSVFGDLYEYGDYFTINVSSPNTPNLRSLQEKESLGKLLAEIVLENKKLAAKGGISPKSILVKVSPDLSREKLDDIIEVCLKHEITGIIATNSTIDHVFSEGGGLTGQPLKERSTEVIRYLYGKTGGKILIVGVGGIASGEDAYEKIRAGASLIQVYTGLIYEGPSLVKKINRTLVKLMERDGFSNIQEAVGSGSKLVIGK